MGRVYLTKKGKRTGGFLKFLWDCKDSLFFGDEYNDGKTLKERFIFIYKSWYVLKKSQELSKQGINPEYDNLIKMINNKEL